MIRKYSFVFLYSFYMQHIWPSQRISAVNWGAYKDELGAYCAGGEL